MPNFLQDGSNRTNSSGPEGSDFSRDEKKLENNAENSAPAPNLLWRLLAVVHILIILYILILVWNLEHRSSGGWGGLVILFVGPFIFPSGLYLFSFIHTLFRILAFLLCASTAIAVFILGYIWRDNGAMPWAILGIIFYGFSAEVLFSRLRYDSRKKRVKNIKTSMY
ncbi:hypothetical protein LJC24_04640 [Desulfococcaceae bacterium OttesenSCG-928-F15]|nr:hypothetical protein [Desulfococcaceae bacterium OttesenSCG-928-F15]